jgi:hypothetical protein
MQFGVGLVRASQFTVAGFALALMEVAWLLVAQIDLYLQDGRGQMVWRLAGLPGLR